MALVRRASMLLPLVYVVQRHDRARSRHGGWARCGPRRSSLVSCEVMQRVSSHANVAQLKICREDLIRNRGKHRGKFNEEYEVGRMIGEGAYGCVAEARHRRTGTAFAVKTIKKSHIRPLDAESSPRISRFSAGGGSFEAEINALTLLIHPHVVHLLEFFEEDSEYHLVLEFCSGPDLFDYLVDIVGKRGYLPEREVAVLLRHMLKGLLACHTSGIVHNDIKPENYMFRKGPGSSLKMVDLGLSAFYKDGQHTGRSTTYGGTLEYAAPEAIDGKLAPECDVWSLGVICYAMLYGKPLFPLEGMDSDEHKIKLIRDKSYVKNALMNDFRWEQLSKTLQDLLLRMLEHDPRRRITVQEALKHDFIQDSYLFCPHCGVKREPNSNGVDLKQHQQLMVILDIETAFVQQTLDRARCFARAPALQRLALTLIAHDFTGSGHATTSEAGHYRRLFRSMNVEGDGRLTLQEFRNSLEVHGIHVEADFDSIFNGMDTAAQGHCTILDFLAAVIEPDVVHRPEVIDAVWSELDRKRTGFITCKDLQALVPKSMDNAQAVAIMKEVSNAPYLQTSHRKVTYDDFRKMMLSYGRAGGTFKSSSPEPNPGWFRWMRRA